MHPIGTISFISMKFAGEKWPNDRLALVVGPCLGNPGSTFVLNPNDILLHSFPRVTN